MGAHVIKKGLDLPIAGAPERTLSEAKSPQSVAVVASDYIGMKPTFLVKEGDAVKRGQALFEDKKTPGVLHTSPAAGTVKAINRGARRALQTVVVALSEGERNGAPADGEVATFNAYSSEDAAKLDGEQVKALLLESGLWAALRTRPYSKTPPTDTRPHSIFVTATDTNPLAPPTDMMVQDREADLEAGLKALSKLTDGKVHFCKAADAKMSPPSVERVSVETFAGPHPSGIAGTHIHLIDPVSRNKTVWTVGLQDLLSIGTLFRTGALDVTRIISLAGPGVKKPRILKTRVGASVDDLVEGELKDGELRLIAGSVLSGRAATGEIHGYLGRYHNQVSVVSEGREREFLGWMSPGAGKFSISNMFMSKLAPGKKFEMTTTTHGSPRAMVPIGLFEKVMPMDILPTFLLRSLLMDDLERAEELGCLELDEEDLALCTFVCPGKTEYGPVLRRNLTTIEKEG